ncbi:MAG: AAA family ATPase [Actinomycetota bacterium]|nr:AAA family ATPase [Actinomycetota bacterium]
MSPGRVSASQGRARADRSKSESGRPAVSFDGLLASREILVACGPGGVGKTTTAAAAAAVAAARIGGKVLVLTVDPARRLANALGLEGIGNAERRVPEAAFAAAGVKPMGELWAAMLDTKESWDALIRRHAPDESTRDQILANPLYRNISGRFVQSHDYIAMERLFEIHSEGSYDLIVVDTPPTRNALDFLDAPERMADFFSSRLLRWLIVPYRSKLVNLASKPFYQVADRILGSQFLSDIAEFFVLFQSMYDGFVERARSVERLLGDRRTSFVVISTLETVPLREAEFFAAALAKRELQLGAVVLNKVLPAYLRDPVNAALAERMRDDAAGIAGALCSKVRGLEPDQATRVVAEVARSFLDFRVVAQREAEQQAELSGAPDVLVSVPYYEEDIVDLSGLLRLGESLWNG